MKLYFDKSGEGIAYDITYWKEYVEDNNLAELILFEAKADMGNGYFWCKELQEIGEVSEGGCGKMCDHYKPRNSKSGRCIHSGHTYDMTDKKRVLTSNKQTK